jgi:integrase
MASKTDLSLRQSSSLINAPAAHYLKLGLEKSPNTVRAYRADLDCYSAWCERQGLTTFPADAGQVANYISDLAPHYKVSTITRRLAMLTTFHELQGYESPTGQKVVQTTLDGIRREKGIRHHEAPAFGKEALEKVMLSLDEDVNAQLRDKVVLLLGFTGAFRRGELTALNVEDLFFDEDGILIDLRKSKTDQLGSGRLKAIFYASHPQLCPVRSTRRYLDRVYPAWKERAAGNQNVDTAVPPTPLLLRMRKGDKFGEQRLTDQSVHLLVMKYFGQRYSAHSLRASFVTVAKKNGASNSEIMAQTHHQTEAMIRRYTRFEDIREHNAGTKLGL